MLTIGVTQVTTVVVKVTTFFPICMLKVGCLWWSSTDIDGSASLKGISDLGPYRRKRRLPEIMSGGPALPSKLPRLATSGNLPVLLSNQEVICLSPH